MRLENGKVLLDSEEALGVKVLTGESVPDTGVTPGELKARIAQAYRERMNEEPGKVLLWNIARGVLEDLDRMASLN